MNYSVFKQKYGTYFSHKKGGIYGITVPNSLVHVVDPKKCAEGGSHGNCVLHKGSELIKVGEGGLKSCESSLMHRISNYSTYLPNGFTIQWICIRPRSGVDKEEACLKGELSDKKLHDYLKKEKLHFCGEWFFNVSAVKRASMLYHEQHFPNCSFYTFTKDSCTRVMPKPRIELDILLKKDDEQSKKEVKTEWAKTHKMELRKSTRSS
ncbi:MAG: hypothetical protein WB421_13780 [Terriglobales bacterium]